MIESFRGVLESLKDGRLYQGTALAVPIGIEEEMGFSLCGILLSLVLAYGVSLIAYCSR